MTKLKDYQLLIFLCVISFISVYFMPAMVNRLVFLVILFAAYQTKLDYVYLVWFFIINDAPGRLFSAGAFGAVRIPLYPVAAGISIGFQEFFLILYIYKLLQMQRPWLFIFKQEFTWFYIFGLFIVAYSFILGMSFDNIVRTFRTLLPWSLIFIVPAYIYSRGILIRSSLMFFPVVLLAFGSQIFSYITGEYLDYYLRGVESRLLSIEEGRASRAHSAVYVTLFGIIQAFYFFYNRRQDINKNYLALVFFLGIYSIILTATRGWMIAMAVLLLGVLILFGLSEISRSFKLAAIATILLLGAVTFMPQLIQQLEASFERFSTMEALVHGDLTADGTLQRLDVRGPRVMSKFRESPILGFGFSNEYYEYRDGHVGHHNILLNIGIIGYIFVNGLFVYLCYKIWIMARKKMIRLQEGKAPLIFVLGLIVVLIIHSSSTQFWGYTLSMNKVLFISYFFASINMVLSHNEQESITARVTRVVKAEDMRKL